MMIITDAYAQCGDNPPYNLLNIPVRMNGETPQIKLGPAWVDFPINAKLNITEYYGQPCVGITSSWRYADEEDRIRN